MKKLSIVIPCYNIESYIEQFRKNLNQQTLDTKAYEVIFVDDQSTDNGLENLKKWKKSNQNHDFKIIELSEKGGAGGARNAGLHEACGKYIMFIDMDDEFAEAYFEKMVNRIEQTNAEVVISEYVSVTPEGKKIPYKLTSYANGERSALFMAPAPWNKIFDREFIIGTGIEYQLKVRHQDLGTITKWIYLAEKIEYLLEPLYYYQMAQPGSITMKTSNFNKDIYTILEDLTIFFEAHNRPDIGENLVYLHLLIRHLYYANHNFNECVKYHRYMIEYINDKYPQFEKRDNFKKLGIVLKLPYYVNIYTKGIFSAMIFRMIVVLNLEKFLNQLRGTVI